MIATHTFEHADPLSNIKKVSKNYPGYIKMIQNGTRVRRYSMPQNISWSSQLCQTCDSKHVFSLKHLFYRYNLSI